MEKQAVEKQAMSAWISIKDGFPEERAKIVEASGEVKQRFSEEVLVVTDGGYHHVAYCVLLSSGAREWFSPTDDRPIREVTHWMSYPVSEALPAPCILVAGAVERGRECLETTIVVAEEYLTNLRTRLSAYNKYSNLRRKAYELESALLHSLNPRNRSNVGELMGAVRDLTREDAKQELKTEQEEL